MGAHLKVLPRATAVQSARDLSPAALREAGCDVIAGQVAVQIPDGRTFAVVRTGRRWTRVAEYLSNGQLTARFFMDEATGEVRDSSRGWKQAGARTGGGGAEFVAGIVQSANELR